MKVIAFTIAAFVSLISACVSWSVMSSITFVYGFIAIAFEAAKPFLIYSCSQCWGLGDNNRAVVLGFIAVCLSAVSVFASVTMLETGVNTLKTESSQYKSTVSQIERLESLAKKQIDSNQITNASKTEDKIAKLTAALPSKQSDTVLTENALPMAVVVSVLAELVVASVLLCIPYSLNKSSNVHIESITNNIQINALVHVRDSILRGETKPSFRGVAANFKGLKREDVRSMFVQMHNNGELVTLGKGYELACEKMSLNCDRKSKAACHA